MSYRCGLDAATAAMLGTDAGGPRVTCDGCGLRISAVKPSGMPYSWLLDHKAPKGWALVNPLGPESGRRRDYCPTCKAEALKELGIP